MALPKKAPLKPISEADLLRLNEPLSVNVHKIYHGNRPMKVNLPPARNDPAFQPGKGYTVAEVNQINVLLDRISGGGTFTIQVMDDSGASVEGGIWLDPQLVPDKVPPEQVQAIAEARAAGATITTIAPATPPPDWIGQTPSAPPRLVAGQVMPAATADPGAYDRAQREADARQRAADAKTAEERARAAEEQLRLARETAMAREHQLSLEKKEAEHRSEMDKIREEMRRLSEAARTPPPPADNGLKDLLASLAARVEKAEAAAASGGMMQMITAMMQQSQESSRQMMAMFMSKPSGIDPTVNLVIETLKANADAAKENMRAMADAQRERDKNQIGARDIIEMADKIRSTSGGGELIRTMTDGMTAVMAMTKQAMELQGGDKGPHPAVQVISEVLEKGAAAVKDFTSARRDMVVGEQKMRAAQVQAEAYAAVNAGAGANGAAKPAAPAPAPIPPDEKAARAANAKAAADLDVQRFGQAVEFVERLRKGVAAKTLTPEQCIATFRQLLDKMPPDWNVPALKLLDEQRVTEFIAWCLPNCEPAFRQKLSELLDEMIAEDDEGEAPVVVEQKVN